MENETKEEVYDDLSVVHDWICYQMDSISQVMLDQSPFQLGRFRAFRAIALFIEDLDINPDGSTKDKLKKFYFKNGESLIEENKRLKDSLYKALGTKL